MAFETGTASSYKDLLAKLRTFVTTNAALVAAGQAWTSLRYDNTSAEHELILRGPGLGGDDEIYVGIKTESSSGSDYYNWLLYGFTGYESAAVITVQPGVLTFADGGPKLLLSNGSIKYWFVANGRRIVIIAKVSTVYESAYLGLITPYGPPTSYPYPLFIGGSYCQHGDTVGSPLPRWSCTTMHHNAFPWAAGRYVSSGSYGRDSASAAFFFAGWIPVRSGCFVSPGSTSQNTTEYEGLQANAAMISPFCEAKRYSYGDNPSMSRSPGPPYGGNYPVCPALLMKGVSGKNVFGQFDGVFWTPGYGLVAEDVLTVDSVNFLVVPNTFRSAATDYFLLKME